MSIALRGITRRGAIAGLGGAFVAGRAGAQKKGGGPLPRATPSLCLFSEAIKVDYNDAGGFLQMIGFDGVELSVQPGGHIPLEGDIDLHLERAIEAMTGSGLDVPVLSTTITSVQSKELRTIMGWGSEMGVPILSPGQWPNRGDGMAKHNYGATGDFDAGADRTRGQDADRAAQCDAEFRWQFGGGSERGDPSFRYDCRI